METYVVALDQGTTSSRAILFNRAGESVSRAQYPFRQIYPQPGWVEHDPLEIWATQKRALKEAVNAAHIDPKQIAALGITNQRETTILWDRVTGEPVYNAIVWQCRRTAGICDRLKADGLDEMVTEKTGLLIDAYFSGTKLKWLLDHIPGARERAERGELCAGTVDSWLIWKLTGGKVHVTDYSNASRTMLFNIHTLQWDEELCTALDLPLNMLPEARRKAMLYGDWNAFEGAFFPEFDYEAHTCDVFEIPKNWLRFRALDYGLDMTACLWLAVSDDRTLYVYRELYESDRILSDAGRLIAELTPPGEAIRYTVASPDLWNRRQDSGKSGFDILHSAGVERLVKANNARIPGWRVLREYLHKGENGRIRLKIFKSCKNLIRTLPLLRFDTHVIEDASDTPHEITHAPEALRYAVMSRVPEKHPKVTPFRSALYSFDTPPREEGYGEFIAY